MITHPWHNVVRFLVSLMLAASAWRAPAQFAAAPTHCELCAKAFTDRYYTIVDKVLDKRRMICGECVQRPQRCFACGLPVPKDIKTLADGRHFCARDAAQALLTPAAVLAVTTETESRLRRQFEGDMEFPNRNLGVTLVDRVNIEALFARPGHDHHCPNVLGYYQSKTNGNARGHEVYLLSGLTASSTRAVLAHELTHAWLADNLPADRALAADAEEGFCELIAYLHLKELHDEPGMRSVALNKYTRGQFDLFRQAHEAYNLQAVIEWIKFGREALIPAEDIDVVRRVQPPARTPPRLWAATAGSANGFRAATVEAAVPVDDQLRLKAVMGTEKRRVALINNRSFETGETGSVSLAGNEQKIRCLEIGADFVRIELIASGEQQTLQLGTGTGP